MLSSWYCKNFGFKFIILLMWPLGLLFSHSHHINRYKMLLAHCCLVVYLSAQDTKLKYVPHKPSFVRFLRRSLNPATQKLNDIFSDASRSVYVLPKKINYQSDCWWKNRINQKNSIIVSLPDFIFFGDGIE